MSKQLNFQLTEDQVTQVEQAKRKDKRAEVRHRATSVHWLHPGHTPLAVAQMPSVTVQAIYHWYHRFVRAGVARLANQPKGHRKTKADAGYLQTGQVQRNRLGLLAQLNFGCDGRVLK